MDLEERIHKMKEIQVIKKKALDSFSFSIYCWKLICDKEETITDLNQLQEFWKEVLEDVCGVFDENYSTLGEIVSRSECGICSSSYTIDPKSCSQFMCKYDLRVKGEGE